MSSRALRSPSVPVSLALAVAVLLGMLAVAGAAPARSDAERPVVLIGASGLTWADVDESTPTLAGLGDDAAVGSLVVRSMRATACPADGWLAISAGNRVADDTPEALGGGCRALEDPVDGAVPGWDTYATNAAEGSFAADPGLLQDRLSGAGVSTTAIGPGAAIALASTDGVVEHYEALTDGVGTQVADALTTSDVVVVDLGPLPGSEPPLADARADRVAEIDSALALVLEATEATGSDPLVIVSGIADASSTAQLRLLSVTGLGAGTVTSPSTRQDGYVLAPDQHATVLATVGVDIAGTSAVGQTISVEAGPDDPVAAALDRAEHAEAQRPLQSPFSLVLVVLNLLLYAGVALGLRRPRVIASVARRRDVVLRAVRVLSLGLASLPLATFLTNMLPWWRVDPSVLGFVGGALAWTALIVAAASFGPWRRSFLGPGAFVAGATALTLLVDVALGATLQLGAVMGVSPLVAGRFYGMNNTAFALLTASSLMVAIAVSDRLVRAGRRRQAAAAVAAIGAVAIIIDGAPSLGADFGGPPALLLAFGLMALMALGVSLTWVRVLALGVSAGALTIGIAFLDWLRPAGDRTHLGAFFDDVVTGNLWPVIWRKLDQNLTILFNNRPLTILAICAVLLVVFVLIRPIRRTLTSPDGGDYAWLSRGAPISDMAASAPMLAPGLISLAVGLGVGFAINDSGIAIPALGFTLAVPLLLASCASWMLPTSAEETGGIPEGDAGQSPEALRSS